MLQKSLFVILKIFSLYDFLLSILSNPILFIFIFKLNFYFLKINETTDSAETSCVWGQWVVLERSDPTMLVVGRVGCESRKT